MPRVIFVLADGTRAEIDDDAAQTAMEAARFNGIEGILGDCGGSMSCGTCHAYVDDAWVARTGDPTPGEEDLLQGVEHRRSASRLTCQIQLSEDLDGIVLHLPG